MEIIPSGLKIDFLGKRYIAYFFSLLIIAGSVYVWIDRGEAKYGIDYSGGHEVVVRLPAGGTQASNSEKVRKALKEGGIDNAIVQSFDDDMNEYALRFSAERLESSEVRDAVNQALKKDFDSNAEIVKQDFVGPTIGAELRQKALVAVLIGLIGILSYITYRFEFAFALGAVAALFHDVIVTMGVYLFFDFNISVATLAAALTIVGYSVNDTIIIFDRMREEIFKRQKFDLIEVMNFSISATLSRTVITSLLTLFSALALLLFGGGAIADLSLFLVVGVITGTYSTIFIASPVALAWENFRNPVGREAAADAG